MKPKESMNIFLYLCRLKQLLTVMKKRITVYGGSSSNISAVYTDAAREVGREIAMAGAVLVNGAGRTGMRGASVEGALEAGGETVGIIPQFMRDRGWHNDRIGELVVAPDMHRRKALMAQSWGCIALPGGIGTFEELCEIITWRQLGLFGGNVVILNIGGFYDPLLAMLDRAVVEGFMKTDHLSAFSVVYTARAAVAAALADHKEVSYTPKF